MTPRHYDPAQVAELAARTRTMNELLDALGVERTGRVRRNMRTRLDRWGIDTSHWLRSNGPVYTDEALAEACASSVSYAQALRSLGVPVTGGQHAHLARRIRAAGIDTSHFLGQAHYRGGRRPGRDPATVFVIWPAGSDRPKTRMLRKAMLDVGVEHRCALCDCDGTWRGEPITLVIDHVNGDWLDNRLENLRFLCPNCHAQTSTWCRKTIARES